MRAGGRSFYTAQIMNSDLANFLCTKDLGINVFVGVWQLHSSWTLLAGPHKETQHLTDGRRISTETKRANREKELNQALFKRIAIKSPFSSTT
jgi:hypothetical protein